MQALINGIKVKKNADQSLPVVMERAPLSNVPFHENTSAVTRYAAPGFPVHLAVHEISGVSTPPREYTQLHQHNDCDEINIILSSTRLRYMIRLGSREYVVHNNSCIWIPKGMLHSANVLEGTGYFITLRLNSNGDQ